MKIINEIKRICKRCSSLPLPLSTRISVLFKLLSASRLFNKAKKRGNGWM